MTAAASRSPDLRGNWLEGVLPAGLGSLTNLQGLAAANSGICVPAVDAFSDWLAAVPDKPGIDGLTACK